MKNILACTLTAMSLIGLSASVTVLAADTSPEPVAAKTADDFAVGKKAIAAKNWALAADSFKKVVADNPKNADGYNLLGYSNRWLGKYEEAFAAYNKALALDPKHIGALEYSGVAYLKVNQLAKAEEQLVKLKAICSGCEETNDLTKAVAAYKSAAK